VKSGHRYCSDCATQLDESAGVEIEVTPAVLGPSGPPQRSAFPPRPVFASSKPAAAIAPRPAPVAPKPVAPKPVAPVAPPDYEASFDPPASGGFPWKAVLGVGGAASVFALGMALALSFHNSSSMEAELTPIARAAMTITTATPPPVPVATPAPALAVAKAKSHPSQGKKVAHARKARAKA